MSAQMKKGECFDAEEFYGKLTEFSESSEEFLDAQESSSEDSGFQTANNNDSLLLHKLAFHGDYERLKKVLENCSEEDKVQLDKQGNTILHVGILQNNVNVLRVGLDCGISSKIRNARGWSALDEAIAAQKHDLVHTLYVHQLQERKNEVKKAKALLIQTLREMPDYSMELNWQLGSPVIGYLLRKFAPHDTYKIYKTGCKIRVDGNLMGIAKNSKALIPEWRRGKFSLLFDGSKTKSCIFLAFHETKEYLDLTEEKQERKKNGSVEADVNLLLAEGVGNTKLRAVDLRFKPVKGWLTAQQTEKIEKWNTVIYEASARMMSVTRLKSNFKMPSTCTFDEYSNLSISEDRVVEKAVDSSSITNQCVDKSPTVEESHGDKKTKGKKLSGRCWMAEDFPMSLQQLLPLLDVLGHANKHLSRVSKFMKKYGDMHMFPIKIQVPLLLTVYLLLSFKKFKYTNNKKISMDLPGNYVRIKLEDVLSNTAFSDIDDKRTTSSSDDNTNMEAFFKLEKENTIEF
eukprot:g539.t1